MLKRLKSCLTFASFVLTIGLAGLWISGRVVILRTVRFADSRSHLFVSHGALQLDCTGLADSLRDFRYCIWSEFSLGRFTDLPAHELATVTADGMWTFRAIGRFVIHTPLQELADSNGNPIFIEQSLPMRLVTLPAWLVIAIAAVLPVRAANIWLRHPRGAWERWNPIKFVARRYVSLSILLSIVICLGWMASEMKYVHLCFSIVDGKSKNWLSLHNGTLFYFLGEREPLAHYENDAFRSVSLNTDRLTFMPWESRFLVAITINRNDSVGIPFWLLLTGTLSVPLTWLLMRLWGKRFRPGHCVDCDYDLRASTGRCPECGRAIDAVAPRVIKPARRQIVLFGSAVVLLLANCVLVTAWTESRIAPCVLFEVIQAKSTPHLAIEFGNVVITTASAPAGATQSPMPVWPFVIVLAGAAGGLLWAGRRIGRPLERN